VKGNVICLVNVKTHTDQAPKTAPEPCHPIRGTRLNDVWHDRLIEQCNHTARPRGGSEPCHPIKGTRHLVAQEFE